MDNVGNGQVRFLLSIVLQIIKIICRENHVKLFFYIGNALVRFDSELININYNGGFL